jgi:hypothetical protein
MPYPAQEVGADERYTPAWVFEGLGVTFDLDPAAPVQGGDLVPARRRFTREHDGLAQPWAGLVWLNPPFSCATAWADRFRAHADGVFLGPVANSRWWYDLASKADVIWHTRDFPFISPTHRGKWSSMPLAIIAMGAVAEAAVRRLAVGDHPGVLVARV